MNMNRRFALTALLAVALAAVRAEPLSAALVLYEPFEYPTTAAEPTRGLVGVDGTTISSQATGANAGGYINPSNTQRWVPRAHPAGSTYTVANDAAIVGNNLTVAGLQSSSGNAANYGGLGYSALLPLGQVFTPSLAGTEVYYSLAFQIADLGTLGPSGGLVAALSNVAATGSIGNPSIAAAGLFVRPDPDNPTTHYQIGLGKTGAGAPAADNWTSATYALGAMQFVVGRYTLNTQNADGTNVDSPSANPAGANDVASLWINPDPLTFGALTAPAVSLQNGPLGNDPPGANNTIQSFHLRQAGPTGNATLVAGSIIADEIRVGTTWAAVTPAVPEPSAVALAAIGMATALVRCGLCRRSISWLI